MRGHEMLDKIENLDPAYIEAAGAKTKANKIRWAKRGAMAAGLAVVLIAGVYMLPGNNSVQTSDGGVAREYRKVSVSEAEVDIVWPWEYMTISEQYASVIYDGVGYTIKATNQSIDSSFVGETIGTCDAVGYDISTEQEYHENFEVRQITGISPVLMIAVNMDGQLYVFKNEEYNPPTTFGDILDGYSLSKTLTFERFGVYENGTESGYYSLSDDDNIWKILTECRDAQFVEADVWNYVDKDYISFTATSEVLGVYKRVFYVSSDGYVRTNIFDWGYTFNIGENAAKEIISYAKENAAETDREPYTYSLAGTLVEIGDGYILVDDTILCADQDDGMVFKVLTSDLRISRCLDCQNIEIGDLVVIDFMGEVDTDAGNLVSDAISMTTGTIYDGEVQIPE